MPLEVAAHGPRGRSPHCDPWARLESLLGLQELSSRCPPALEGLGAQRGGTLSVREGPDNPRRTKQPLRPPQVAWPNDQTSRHLLPPWVLDTGPRQRSTCNPSCSVHWGPMHCHGPRGRSPHRYPQPTPQKHELPYPQLHHTTELVELRQQAEPSQLASMVATHPEVGRGRSPHGPPGTAPA